MKKKDSIALQNFTFITIILVILVYVLYIGASLIIPFVIAILISIAIIGLYNFFIKRKFPKLISIILSIFIYLSVFQLISFLIQSNVNDLIILLPVYQEKLYNMSVTFSQSYNLPPWLSIGSLIESINIQAIISSLVGAITSILSKTGLIIIYIVFILLEYRFFREKTGTVISKFKNHKDIESTIHKIRSDIKTYFVVKTLISFLSAILSYFIMLGFGLDFAAFWAVIIFILNFIPSIGSIIALALPCILSFVQPDFTIAKTIFLTVSLVGLDQITGNFLEPKLMGNRLNLSPVVIILSLGFWGMIWGIVGMFLSAPIMVIINIILSKIPATKPIAILLSEKGDLPKTKKLDKK